MRVVETEWVVFVAVAVAGDASCKICLGVACTFPKAAVKSPAVAGVSGSDDAFLLVSRLSRGALCRVSSILQPGLASEVMGCVADDFPFRDGLKVGLHLDGMAECDEENSRHDNARLGFAHGPVGALCTSTDLIQQNHINSR